MRGGVTSVAITMSILYVFYMFMSDPSKCEEILIEDLARFTKSTIKNFGRWEDQKKCKEVKSCGQGCIHGCKNPKLYKKCSENEE